EVAAPEDTWNSGPVAAVEPDDEMLTPNPEPQLPDILKFSVLVPMVKAFTATGLLIAFSVVEPEPQGLMICAKLGVTASSRQAQNKFFMELGESGRSLLSSYWI